MSKRTAAGGGGGHTRKHTSAAKHTRGKAKHHPSKQKTSHHKTTTAKVHTVASHPKATRRGLALADEVACCAAEAIAASLRLTGRPVSDSAVLALHGRVRDATDEGASILAALEAVSTWGLGGVRPVRWAPAGAGAGLLLGVDLPGPHTVCVAPCGCWSSWGHWYEPDEWPDAVIEECWEVTWPS